MSDIKDQEFINWYSKKNFTVLPEVEEMLVKVVAMKGIRNENR